MRREAREAFFRSFMYRSDSAGLRRQCNDLGLGLGSLTLCSNKLKSQEYLNILDDQVHPSIDFYFPDGSGIFQDDNTPIHRFHVVQDWFRDHEGSFSHM